jgi:hypothetical protein
MAVSLVSTGVQFPDSTIQTTAASPALTLIGTSTANATGSSWFVSVGVTGWASTYKYLVWTLSGKLGTSTSSTNMVWAFNSLSGSNYYEYGYWGSTVTGAASSSYINNITTVSTNVSSVNGWGIIQGTESTATYNTYPTIRGNIQTSTRGTEWFSGGLRRDTSGYSGQITSVQYGTNGSSVTQGNITLTIYGVA